MTVFRTKFVTGWDGDEASQHLLQTGQIESGDVLDLKTALNKRYTTDAHFAQYSTPGALQMPRLNKSSLGYFLTVEPEAMPVLQNVAVDIILRAANRNGGYPAYEDVIIGFRVAEASEQAPMPAARAPTGWGGIRQE